MLRWVQVNEAEVDYWIEKEYINPKHKESAYRYIEEDNNETKVMYEFHVDTCEYIYDTYAGRAGQF